MVKYFGAISSQNSRKIFYQIILPNTQCALFAHTLMGQSALSLSIFFDISYLIGIVCHSNLQKEMETSPVDRVDGQLSRVLLRRPMLQHMRFLSRPATVRVLL